MLHTCACVVTVGWHVLMPVLFWTACIQRMHLKLGKADIQTCCILVANRNITLVERQPSLVLTWLRAPSWRTRAVFGMLQANRSLLRLCAGYVLSTRLLRVCSYYSCSSNEQFQHSLSRTCLLSELGAVAHTSLQLSHKIVDLW